MRIRWCFSGIQLASSLACSCFKLFIGVLYSSSGSRLVRALGEGGFKNNSVFIVSVFILSTHILDFPWDYSTLIEIWQLGKLSLTGQILSLIILIISFSAWIMVISKIAFCRIWTRRAVKRETHCLLSSAVLLTNLEVLLNVFYRLRATEWIFIV